MDLGDLGRTSSDSWLGRISVRTGSAHPRPKRPECAEGGGRRVSELLLSAIERARSSSGTMVEAIPLNVRDGEAKGPTSVRRSATKSASYLYFARPYLPYLATNFVG